MASCASAIVIRSDKTTRKTSTISIPPRQDEPIAIEYDTARMTDVRPKIQLADNEAISRMQSCLDFMRFNTYQQPVHVESQRGSNIPYWSVRRWRGGTIFLSHIDGLVR